MHLGWSVHPIIGAIRLTSRCTSISSWHYPMPRGLKSRFPPNSPIIPISITSSARTRTVTLPRRPLLASAIPSTKTLWQTLRRESTASHMRGRKSGYALSKNISKREHQHRDLSTSLRSGRDDKGWGRFQGEKSLHYAPPG